MERSLTLFGIFILINYSPFYNLCLWFFQGNVIVNFEVLCGVVGGLCCVMVSFYLLSSIYCE